MVADELNKKGVTTKAWMTKHGVFREGKPWHKMHIYRVLYNRTYLGEVIHKEKTYPGEHEAIVTQDMWRRAHMVIEENTRSHVRHARAKAPALLRGIIRCAACDTAMSPVSATSKDRIYRYYQCGRASKHGYSVCPVKSVPAGEIEGAVIQQLRAIFRSPEMIAQTYRATQELEIDDLNRLKEERGDIESRVAALRQAASRLMESGNAGTETSAEIRRTNEEFVGLQHRLTDINEDIAVLESRMVSERDVTEALRKLDPIWDELYPLEQTRVIQLLVEQVTVSTDGMRVRIRSNGLHSLVSELKSVQDRTENEECLV